MPQTMTAAPKRRKARPDQQTGKAVMGRPPVVTPSMQDDICDWIAGGQSMASWCREMGVAYRTVGIALQGSEDFQRKYAMAREASAHADADEVTHIRERVMKGEISPEVGRVAIDACKWTAGKRQPKVYGDRIGVDVSGEVTFATRAALAEAIANRQSELAAARLAIEQEREAGPVVEMEE